VIGLYEIIRWMISGYKSYRSYKYAEEIDGADVKEKVVKRKRAARI
jgi:hypothetical protein